MFTPEETMVSGSQMQLLESNMITVKVLNPEKVGEGISSYVVYTIKTITNIPSFVKSNMCVQRRFSDFIGLYEKLKAKYLPQGIIIPYPPEKNVIGTTKLRLSKGSSADTDFIEKRRVSLECFLHRLTNHPILVNDAYVREFIEVVGELPRHAGPPVLSGATAKKLFKNVGEAVGKWANKMDETDEYFDFRDQELENWDIQGSRLYTALSILVADQSDLAGATLALSKTLSDLANVEEHTGLARALGQLSDTEERMSQFQLITAEAQSTFLVEYSKGLLSMIQACRETLSERVRVFKNHRDVESLLRGKREQKVRIEMSPKSDRAKIPQLEREIGDLVRRVEESEVEFGKLSATIKKELEQVDEARFEEFKAAVIGYISTMLQVQEKTLKVWEAFIGHSKAIE